MAHLSPPVSVERQGLDTISSAGSHQYQYTQVNGGTNFQGNNYGHINFQSSHFHHNDHSTTKLDFLKSLDPGVTTARYNSITNTKYDTFEWVFKEEKLKGAWPPPTPSIPEWLRGSKGTFLVSGKAGSGKSTFMKFLVKHPQTLSSLEQWAAGNHVVILFHGFWASGTKHEYSMKGLLASCIYQFATQVPSALEKLNLLPGSVPKFSIDHWSQDELYDLLFVLLEQSSTCCCLFLDGLDEFDHQDDDDHIFELVAEMQSRSKTKVCLSSRPMPHVLKRLIKSPTVRLQDLTWDDIYKHVWNTLREKTSIAGQADDANELRHLAHDMCSKADGVFLWVHYVLHNVCKGLRVADEIPELRKRIDELPSEIIDMYEAIWEKNNRDHSVYKKQAAKILSMHRYFPMPLFQLAALVLPNLVNHYSIGQNSMGEDNLDQICNAFLERLPTLSAGLLECREVDSFTVQRSVCHYKGTQSPSSSQLKGGWRKMEVQFIHRTVRDFLVDNTFSGALLGDVYNEHATIHGYVHSLLACFIEGVAFDLTLRNIAMVCSTLSSIRREDADIVDQIDATYSALVQARRPTLKGSTSNWVHCLMETDTQIYRVVQIHSLDFPSFLASCPVSPSCIMHVLSARGSQWTPYYKGWLASCLGRNLAGGRFNDHHWANVIETFIHLTTHDADITTPQPILSTFWYIRSPVLSLLSWLVAEILSDAYVRKNDVQALLNSIGGLNLNSQLVTLCARDTFGTYYFYGEAGPMGNGLLVSFVATDLVEMLAALLSECASNCPQTRKLGHQRDGRQSERLLSSQCRAHCRVVVRDVGKVIPDVLDKHHVALLCSSAVVRSQILDYIFRQDTDSPGVGLRSLEFDGPVWIIPDADSTIPYPSGQSYTVLPVDPYVEVLPHEWKQHCILCDYYAKEAQIQAVYRPERRVRINRWREKRPVWSQSKTIYDDDLDRGRYGKPLNLPRCAFPS